MASSFSLALAALIVHAILLASIFDIYFTSPVESGLEPQYYSLKPPAKRLVLFVADGLRADTVFSVDDDGQSPAPFLREVIERKGRWGVSHTHVPTESRPGHVALIAGLYEDVSAVTRGWRENPVLFDSVFNQSKHTWSWGSPDILPMFSQGAAEGRVETFMYDASWEDFADSDASKLDWWVFNKVGAFFEHAKVNKTLAGKLAEDKNVFFLHLLGIDTNGHAHRPYSKEVIDNLKFVDAEIRKIVDTINSYFGDDKTVFVFTSDHGMTDWGSHGAGLPEETMTPLICWGAGIKSPRSNTYAETVYHDGYSEKWGLQRLERVDVEQADIAPLMTTLFGGAIPVNSEGVLPMRYIHYNKGFVAASIETNSRQLFKQVEMKESRLRSNSLPYLFHPYPKMSISAMADEQAKMKSLCREKQYQMAIDLSIKQIEIYKEAVRYYHTYHRSSLLLVLSFGFIGWMICTFMCILDDNIHSARSFRGPNSKAWECPIKLIVLWCFVCILLYLQSSPLLYYLYYSLTIFSWRYVWKNRFILQHARKLLRGNLSSVFKSFIGVLLIFCELELLVLSFFYREVLSVILLSLSAWPFATELRKKQLKLCVAWCVTCSLLAIFPLLPVVGRTANYNFVILAGLLMSLSSFVLLSIPSISYVLCSSLSRSHLLRRFFILQNVLLMLSSFVPAVTNWYFRQKESIPIVINIFCWVNMCISISLPFLGPRSVTGRLFHILLTLYTTFVLLSTSFEALFVLLLCSCLYFWLAMEDALAPAKFKLSTVWEAVISFKQSKVVTILPNEMELPRPSVSFDDLRQVFICIVLGMFSYFGTGNIASVNTFDPATVYCFLTVFSPFVMGALILWKMVVPFIFVSCVFNIIISLTNRSLKTHLLLMLLMSDIMGLNFFFLVRDSGSWLEIGVSISHYIIMMAMIIGIIILVGVARLLTGLTVIPRKSEESY